MLFCVGCIILHHYTSQCVSVCITTTKKKIVVTLRRYYDREHTDLGGRLTFIDFTYFFIFIVILLAVLQKIFFCSRQWRCDRKERQVPYGFCAWLGPVWYSIDNALYVATELILIQHVGCPVLYIAFSFKPFCSKKSFHKYLFVHDSTQWASCAQKIKAWLRPVSVGVSSTQLLTLKIWELC